MAIKVDDAQLKKNFEQLTKNMNDKSGLRRLGGFVIKTIRERTRGDGKGVARPGGNRTTLRIVSDEWAARRAVASGKHPQAATGKKSNLTFMGTMLDSMITRTPGQGKLFIGFKNKKESDKAEGNEERGRPFMYLGKVEIRSASDYIKKNILRGV